MAAWTPAKAPRSSIRILPPPPSSAGVPRTRTASPMSSATAERARPAPTAVAAMMLCPQAWPRSGSASYSAQTAITRSPPPDRDSSAVGRSYTPSATSRPPARIVSATARAETVSPKHSSGVWWRKWLSETSSSRCSSTTAAAASLADEAAPVPAFTYSMTATTSPAPTESPALDPDLLHHAVLLRGDGVLHLHGLEKADRLAHLDDVANRDQDLDDGALHRDGDLARSGAGHRRRGGPLRPSRCSPGGGGRAQVGHPQPHREAPAVDLGRDVALDRRHLVLDGAGAGTPRARPPRRSGRGSPRPTWSSASPPRSRGG